MNKKIGFLGCGNMGRAMLGGILKAELVCPNDIFVSVSSPSSEEKIRKEFKVNVSVQNELACQNSDILILAVKPQIFKAISSKISKLVKPNCVIVSVMAGITLDYLKSVFPSCKKIVRAMPNTPALSLEAMSAICGEESLSRDELDEVMEIFNSFGKTEIVSEELFDAVIGISGSAPAYVFMFIEALADAGVLEGMPRDKAYSFASQAVLGSAKMVLDTKLHPAVLKDMVCSPKGTTIEAVKSLENDGFRSAVINAVGKCCDKSREMSKK